MAHGSSLSILSNSLSLTASNIFAIVEKPTTGIGWPPPLWKNPGYAPVGSTRGAVVSIKANLGTFRSRFL